MGSPGGTRKCVSCGREIAMDANVCQYCGHDYRMQTAPAAPAEKSMLSLVGGILILISGIMGLIFGGIFIVAADAVQEGSEDLSEWGFDVGGMGDFVTDILLMCGAIVIILAIIVVLGGFFGIQRKRWSLALVGGILGLFFFIPYFIGTICALVGLILIAISKKDFS